MERKEDEKLGSWEDDKINDPENFSHPTMTISNRYPFAFGFYPLSLPETLRYRPEIVG